MAPARPRVRLLGSMPAWYRAGHELSHREVKTADHRYRHHASGRKPDAADAKFTAAKALDNADSWALFCMDCAGQMSSGDYTKVKV